MNLAPLPDLWTLLLSIVLIAIGQTLNAFVWYRIGVEGVCYGKTFGRNPPWCTQFPYNLLSDPQYIGAIFTVWGLFLLVSEGAPLDWFVIPVIETVYYMVSMKVEF